MTAAQLHSLADRMFLRSFEIRRRAQRRRTEEIAKTFIVTTRAGQPLKLGGFKFACTAIATPVDVEDAREEATAAAERMANLSAFEVLPLVPLDQQ